VVSSTLWPFFSIEFYLTVIIHRSIADVDGPLVADSFYKHLFHETPSTDTPNLPYPDTTKAAEALHIAIAKLRAKKCSFARWVPFIHVGV
jgi:hypothetical protein